MLPFAKVFEGGIWSSLWVENLLLGPILVGGEVDMGGLEGVSESDPSLD